MLSIKTFFRYRKYFASAFFYACFSLIFSTWVTYIPYISEKLNIREGKIGGALFFASLGSFVMIPICNRLVDRIGVGRFTFYSFLIYSLSIYSIFLVPNYIMLCVALFFFGMMGSAFAISLNSLTATVEKQAGMYIMTGSHGFWSIGGIIGATTGSFIAGFLKMPLLHISLLLVVLWGMQIWLRKEYYYIRSDTTKKKSIINSQLNHCWLLHLLDW
jgi:MFS family permease